MTTSDILGIIGIALTVFFGIAGLIVGSTIIKKVNAKSKIGHHSNNNNVNINSNNNNGK